MLTDRDGDGIISAEDLEGAMTSIHLRPTNSEVMAIVKSVAKTGRSRYEHLVRVNTIRLGYLVWRLQQNLVIILQTQPRAVETKDLQL